MGCIAETEADLDENLKYGRIKICLTDDGRIAIGEKTYDLNQVEAVMVEDGIGIGKLILRYRDGREVEAAYFTKSKLAEMSRFANLVNLRRGGGGFRYVPGEVRQGRKAVNTLIWLFRFMRPYWRRLAIGVALSIAIAMLNLVPPYLLKILIDQVFLSKTHPYSLFIKLTLILISSYAAVTGLSIAQNYILNTTGQRVVNDLRYRVFERVMELSSSFVDRVSTGRILSRLTNDAGNTQWLMVWGLPTLIVNLLTLIGIGVILFSMDARLALYILAPIPLIIYMVIRYRRRAHRLYHRNWRRSAEVTSALSDTIPNFNVVKSFAREYFEVNRLGDMLNRLYEAQVDVTKMNVGYWPIIGFLTALSTVAIWWIGGNQVIAGTIELGTLTAFVSYMAQFYGPINNLSNIIPFIQQAITSGDRLREIIEAEPDVKNPPNPKKPSLRGDIVFKDVWFSYDKYTPVLRDVNITIRAGEKVAIVGRSGSGKTTIAKLILRMYDVDSGSVTINGVDVREVDLNYLRSRIAYVPQEVALFDNTVAYNVAYGRNGPVEPWEIIAACKAARIHGEIMSMPLAYDTNLGERGTYLSGGQRQRISIARAIIKQPDIVILDEATSNLDVANEAEVFKAILNLARGRTTIIVTHNLPEVLASDKVIVMENGRVVEVGAPQELVARRGAFYNLFREQLEFLNPEAASIRTNIERDERPLTLYDYVKDLMVDPSKVRISPGSRRSLVNVAVDGRVLRDLRPKQPFPVSHPEYVIFYDREGSEKLMLTDYRMLDEGSRRVLEEALSLNSLKPKILKIKSIEIKGDEVVFDIVTDRGPIKAVVRGRRNIFMQDSKLYLVDIGDNVYEADLKQLDKASLKAIAETI